MNRKIFQTPMDKDLSSLIEHALLYASPLPVTSPVSEVSLTPDDANDDNESVTSEVSSQQHASPSTQTSSMATVPKPKKKRNRQKNPNPPPEPFLPPCSICGVKSSGFHYGANTCEPCKAFFRRTLKSQKLRFKCKCKPEKDEEWKRGPVKNGCSSCRYQRCLLMGMSKDAIKIGRYTLNHKTKNIKEIKAVEGTDHQHDTATPAYVNSPADSGVSSLEDPTVPSIPESPLFSPPASVSVHMEQSHPILSVQEIESIVSTLTEAHTREPFCETSILPMEEIRRKQSDYLEKYKMKTELFGATGLSMEEFTEFYNVTGLDIDGRLEHVQDAFEFFEKKISGTVEFAKTIPEFRTLNLDDQASLIKASRVDSNIMVGYKSFHRNFDFDNRVVTTPWGKDIHMDELFRLVPIEAVFQHKRVLIEKILKVELTIQEDSVIRAIITMFADRCALEEPIRVEQIQEKLVACLQYLLSLRPCGHCSVFYKIIDFITDMRDLTEREHDFARKMFNDWPMVTRNKYQLLKEFLS